MDRTAWIVIGGTLGVLGLVVALTFAVSEAPPETPARVVAAPAAPAAAEPDPPPTPRERASFLLTYAKSDCKHPSSTKITRAIAKHPDWEDRSIEAIACGSIMMGMTGDEVRASWGAPEHINSTQLSSYLSEQWVYASDYVYLENGVVTSWQSSR
jgi:hypothetical protein